MFTSDYDLFFVSNQKLFTIFWESRKKLKILIDLFALIGITKKYVNKINYFNVKNGFRDEAELKTFS